MAERLWADAMQMTEQDADAFARVADDLHIAPEDLLRQLAARVVEADQTARKYGMGGLAAWVSGDEAVRQTTHYALDVLPLDIKETEFMWPQDTPFPWSAEHCKAAVLGYQVRWPGDFDDFWQKVRGAWEMIDGYAVLYQT